MRRSYTAFITPEHYRIGSRSSAPVDRPITTHQQGSLHSAACFDTARLVVITFGGRQVAMAEQAGGDANVFWIIDRDAGSSGISEQVRVDRLS